MARILVVDDESNIRLLYSQELTDDGHEVAAVGSAVEAVTSLHAEAFDLVVLDVKLKNESGLDLLQTIVKERHDIPVILCTAFSFYKDDFSSWLADGYVVKSSDLQELKDEIKRVLAKKTVKRETVDVRR